MSSLLRLIREHFWGVLLIVVLLVGSSIAVKAWKVKHPGAMSVLESQAMDMTVMKPPVGSVPVATEVVHLGKFTAKVTYTGSVAPLQEQTVYPRVDGTLKNLSVYNGDRVSDGQVLGVIDSPDLQSKVAESSAGRTAAASEVPAAKYNAARMSAEVKAAQGEAQSARGELARAKAMLSASQKAVIQRQKEANAAKANLDYWNAEIAREQKLLNAGAVSVNEFQSEQAQAISAKADFENKQAMIEEAKAEVQAAKADVDAKQAMVSSADQKLAAAAAALEGAGYEIKQKAAMARQANAMLSTAASIDSYRYVKAPFAGIVGKRYLSPGQYVNQSSAILSVVQIDKVRLQVNVSDRDFPSIKIGAAVTAHFTKYPDKTIEARVSSISPLADQSSRTAVVEAIIDNPGHKYVPGDSVTMDIAVSGEAESISVPMSAVVQQDGMPAVWIAKAEAANGKMVYYCTMHPEVTSNKPDLCYKCNMDLVPKTSDGNKKANLVMVTTGASSGDRVEIKSGLSDGDEVIYQGNTYLKDGDTVFPTAWGADGPKETPNAPGMGAMPGMNHDSVSAPSEAKQAGKQLYECPMHPDQTSYDPNALCKLCNMKINQPVKR